jgi:DNA replication protein DnaC
MMTEWHSNKYWQNRSKEERLRNLRIPARYLGKNLDTYDSEAGDSEAFNAINHWCSKATDNLTEGMGMVLYGPTGVGKTHLAQGVLVNVVGSHTRSGIFVTSDRYVDMVYDEMRNDGELPEPYSDPFLMKYMRRTFDLVVLDGLGAERATTEFARNALISLVDNRYEEKLTTVVTTSLSPNELSRTYGKRVLSIFQESCYFINVEGPDYRTVFNDAK